MIKITTSKDASSGRVSEIFGFLHTLDASQFFKVHIFWEGHKILQNLHQLFDWQFIGGDFVAFSEYMNFKIVINWIKPDLCFI